MKKLFLVLAALFLLAIMACGSSGGGDSSSSGTRTTAVVVGGTPVNSAPPVTTTGTGTPVISNLVLNPNPAQAGDRLTFSLAFTDTGADVNTFGIQFNGENKYYSYDVSGVASGNMAFNLTVQDTIGNVQPGSYQVVVFVIDALGNVSNYLTSTLILQSNGGSSTYSNASFNGAWLIDDQTPGGQDLYIVSNGNGKMTDIGVFVSTSDIAASSYSVASNGSLTMNIYVDGGYIVGNGQLTSTTTGSVTISGSPANLLLKISELNKLQGSWSGTLTENTSPHTSYDVVINVNSSGEITSLTGFDMPVSGKLYCESGIVVGFIRTSATGQYNQIHINGTLENSVTINGTYGKDNGIEFDGTLTLSKL